jgi:hypothetical protein
MDSTGFFGAVSDYGNYSYLWNAHGREDFRLFVVGLEKSWDYAATKLGGYEKNHVFDAEATAEAIRKEVLEGRRQESITLERAQEEREYAEELERKNITIEQWAERTNLDDPSEYVVHRRAADLEAFCKKLLPRLATMIRAEMGAEQAAPPVAPEEVQHAGV